VTGPINPSEEFVFTVCQKSFLSLWSYANPRGKKNKELCDILVVCDPDIIIFSVKEIAKNESGDASIDLDRWRKRAIDDSVKQIYGAERWISTANHVVKNDGTEGLPFPAKGKRKIHRVAVALGSDCNTSLHFGDFGKGFVHVCNEVSFSIIMEELDTISDFIRYLSLKEQRYGIGTKIIQKCREEDVLAIYLHHGKEFHANFDTELNYQDHYFKFKSKPEVIAKKNADDISYVWDNILSILCDDILRGHIEFGPTLNDSEIALRIMAREDRFNRRMLGKSFYDFYELAKRKKVRSRIALGMSDVTYVFLALPQGEDRKYRVAELGGRCFVARGIHQDRKTVIGLATERYEEGKGFSFDIMYLHMPVWRKEDQTQMEYAQKEFGFFATPQSLAVHEDEYPSVEPPSKIIP